MTDRRSISSRALAIAPSATLAITARAAELRASGRPVIGFAAGEPDFPTPDYIVEAAVIAARDPRNHHYTPEAGLPELRRAIAAKTLRDSGVEVDASQVVVTNGGKQAVYLACQSLIDPGDEVIVPAPYWVTYPSAVELAGGVPVILETREDDGFTIDLERADSIVTDRTKMIIFVSPSNPTGSVYPPDQVEAVGRWAAERGIWVLTDEIYEHLVYGGATFTSLPGLVPEAAPRTVIVNGVAKTYAMTGWRVGWLIGPQAVADGATRIQGHLSSNVANVSQRAALAAVSGPLDAVAEMRAAFDRRRKTMVDLLNGTVGVSCRQPSGAFYAFPNLTGLLNRDIRGRSASTTLDLCGMLLDEAEVAFVPGEAFGAPGYARLSFALGDEDLAEGLGRVQALVGSVGG